MSSSFGRVDALGEAVGVSKFFGPTIRPRTRRATKRQGYTKHTRTQWVFA